MMDDVRRPRSRSISEVKRVRASSSKRSAKAKVLPGRKLTDAVVRSSSGLDYGFSSDIAEPITKRIKDEPREPDSAMKPPSVTRCCWSIFVLAITCSLILFLAAFALGWMQTRCEYLHNLKYDLQKFRQNFSDTIIGQPYASSMIPSVLADFQEEKFTEPRIVWCVGWTGVGKSKSLDLMKHLMTHSSVHYIIPSLLPDNNAGLEGYIASTIFSMNPCLKNIVIVDGWDEKYDNTTIKFIAGFLSGVKEKTKEISHMNQLLVFISGTRSGDVINREYLERRQHGEGRSQMPLSGFVDLVSITEEYGLIKALGPVTVIPFLPLEAEHVAECARREIFHFKTLANQIGNLSGIKALGNVPLENILQRLLEHLPILPSKKLVIPATGCKKILSALIHLIENEELGLG